MPREVVCRDRTSRRRVAIYLNAGDREMGYDGPSMTSVVGRLNMLLVNSSGRKSRT